MSLEISHVSSGQPTVSFKAPFLLKELVLSLLAPKREETLTYTRVVGTLCVAYISSDILRTTKGNGNASNKGYLLCVKHRARTLYTLSSLVKATLGEVIITPIAHSHTGK